ncbi:ClbS/DfsB family four-helix bundle protein [Eubacteriales bacterium OttesenSCG-928-K08]|nr:ClbS/DfsB family four-helix bundle protein [Eubacteriales bacterium OttesenSCG-928-K08]
MPRPQTKNDLIITANEQFDKLLNMIDGMSAEEQNATFCFPITQKDKEAHWKRDKNLRDVLIHLYEWHQLLINWIAANKNGDEATPFLPAPYTWKSYGAMNIGFWEKAQQTSLESAMEMLLQSHKDALAIIEGYTNDELFEKEHFKWSGTTNVGSYCVSATSSHYDWAMKKLKRQIKALS